MTNSEILTVLKTDLQISAAQYDNYLKNIIDLAKAAIQKEGIVLKLDTESSKEMPSYTIEDGMLIAMYAAHLYRKRRETQNAMPRMLRYELNNRLFSQKGSVS